MCGLLGLAGGIELGHIPYLAGQTGTLAHLRDLGIPVLFALIGVALSPYLANFFERVSSSVEESIVKMAPAEALSGAIGLVVGLLVAYLVREIFAPINQIPRYGPIISIVIYALITLFFAYTGIRIGLRQRLSSWMRSGPHDADAPPKLLDTSVIVDGRVLEVVQAGFIEGRLLVPKFVLKELQSIADSADSIRRARGRRGLEILNRLRDISGRLEIIDQDAPERDVDSKLVTLARQMEAPILTNDYNLNRVARLQGVVILNVNELANAIKPVVLPGEEMSVSIVKDGKEQNQGVGYLEDGTMIVVENGKRLIGETVGVQVTSVLQTAAGRMIFARPKKA
ncbi:MAG TPA: PIN domain-containing protein [Candidatus Eremiobacteraceae bacterium]|nr:PIN domain-containing protein [Candidatus Eremiobacteraceae bacterium]